MMEDALAAPITEFPDRYAHGAEVEVRPFPHMGMAPCLIGTCVRVRAVPLNAQ